MLYKEYDVSKDFVDSEKFNGSMGEKLKPYISCLLYTSDAADE